MLLQAAQDAMIARGGAKLGDKTMLDMMDAIIRAIGGKTEREEILAAAQNAATDTLSNYRDKPNKIGRARVYAEKSVGLDDPGMMAIARMIECLDSKLKRPRSTRGQLDLRPPRGPQGEGIPTSPCPSTAPAPVRPSASACRCRTR